MLGLTVLILAGYQGLKDWRFNRDAPAANFPVPANKAEARQQDVEQLAIFFELEKSWSEQGLAASEARYQELVQQAPGLSDAEFELAVARIVALAENAHTKVREYNRTPRFNRLPVRGHWFADGYFIIRAYKGFENLLGYKITAIEGQSIDAVAAELRQYIAGPDGTYHKYLPYLLESPELMHAAGLSKSRGQMEITIEKPDDLSGSASGDHGREPLNTTGQTILLQEPFPPAGDQIARSYYLLAPRTFAESQPDWKSVLSNNERVPLYLQKPIESMQMTEIPELEASYIQFWTNSNVGNVSVKKFCEDSLNNYRATPTRNLIIDQRFNSGGDFTLTRSCLEKFGRNIPAGGHLYIVIGGATFSAGMYAAAILTQSAADKAILVGENVGDKLRSWGEDNLLRLPNSGIEIKFSTGMHDLQNSCTEISKCYWGALFLDLGVETLEPDIFAPLTYRDYQNRLDSTLEAIKNHEISLVPTH